MLDHPPLTPCISPREMQPLAAARLLTQILLSHLPALRFITALLYPGVKFILAASRGGYSESSTTAPRDDDLE